MAGEPWPALPYEAWKDTYATLHMWTQVVGKVALADVPVLYQKWREGVIDRPKYVPRPFRDLNGIAMWMAYSNFFNQMNLAKVQENLKPLILGA